MTSRNSILGAIYFAWIAVLLPSMASGGEVHEHGVGHMNIAIEGSGLSMEIEVPAADIVGFEHEAGTDDEKAQVATAIKLLSDPLKIMVFDDEAGCLPSEAAAQFELEDEDNGEKHAVFIAEYILVCDQPEKLQAITFQYFENFSKAEELDVNLILENKQLHIELDRDNEVLDLNQ